jgi:hypothetical protein
LASLDIIIVGVAGADVQYFIDFIYVALGTDVYRISLT